MSTLAFWKAILPDQATSLEYLTSLLAEHRVCYCLTGDYAVDAYADPLVTLDLELVVAAGHISTLESLCEGRLHAERFPHSLNLSMPGSNLRVQIQTDPRYSRVLERASLREVLGLTLPVAHVEDVLQGKVWAAMEPGRRASKRRKDLLDIERLLEAYPHLRDRVPPEILERIQL